MSLTIPSRRRFLLGAGALLAAPSIARVASLMPVSVLPEYKIVTPWLNAMTPHFVTLEDIIRARDILDRQSVPTEGRMWAPLA